MNYNQIDKIKEYVKIKLTNVDIAHDYNHVKRVVKTSLKIAKGYNVNNKIIEAAAWLHDVTDKKLFNKTKAEKELIEFLNKIELNSDEIKSILKIINSVSFSENKNNKNTLSFEEMIVRDADRLDAIGAIGIARAFTFGGYNNRPLYDKNYKQEYNKNSNSTINHFYEKLLLINDLMLTSKGKEIAIQRHNFLLNYLKQFYSEIE